MNRLKSISLEIPHNKTLVSLLQQLPNFKSSNPLSTDLPHLNPQLIISQSNINSPKISFITEDKEPEKAWSAGNLQFGFNLNKSIETIEIKEEISELTLGREKVEFTSVEKLSKTLSGNLIELNHFGINLGPKTITKQDYLDFRNKLAQKSNLYSYPTGEEWPFLIPSTQEEFKNKITDESIYRNPKLELVFSDYLSEPLIHFDVETKLDRESIQKLFPQPYGISFDGLENIFRSVFIKTDWNGVILRFDIRFEGSRKDFGYWIIKDGKRY